MRSTSLLGRGMEGQIENLNIQDRRITNPPGRAGHYIPLILEHILREDHIHDNYQALHAM